MQDSAQVKQETPEAPDTARPVPTIPAKLKAVGPKAPKAEAWMPCSSVPETPKPETSGPEALAPVAVAPQVSEHKEETRPASTPVHRHRTRPAPSVALGDKLPSIILEDQDAQPVSTGALKMCVIFTFRNAFRNACAKQVREYRVQYKRWLAAGYTVYGLSADEPQTQKSWSKRLCLPFPLLCDPSRTLIHQLTGPWNFTRRGHFVVDAQGRLCAMKLGVRPAKCSACRRRLGPM